VTVTADPPVLSIGLVVTVELKTVPLDGLSSRKVSVSPVMKFATFPLRVVGSVVIVVLEVNVNVGLPPVAVVLDDEPVQLR
jgi:hypothetical protein